MTHLRRNVTKLSGPNAERWLKGVRLAGVFAIAGSLMGCVTGLGPDESPLLQTDRGMFEWSEPIYGGFETAIPYTYHNRTGGRVYLVNCGGSFGLYLQRLEGEEWHVAWSPVLAACLSPPIVIEPEEIFTDTVTVWGGRPEDNVLPKFDVSDPSGVYRLVWDAALFSFQDRLPFGDPLPLNARVSNRFELRLR